MYNKCVYTLYIICCCVLFLCYGVMALHFRENKSMVFVFWILCVANCSLGVFVGECGYSRSVCNVFILCMLHVRKTKAWFLACKSMVFGVQKGGFCIAKVWFLIFECYVVANRSHAFRGWMWIFCGVFATLFQFASSVVGRPLAAVGDRFIVPTYP